MNPDVEISRAIGTEAGGVTTCDDRANQDIYGLDCQMLRNDSENCPLSSPNSPKDPGSLNAFFQSMVHPTHGIFQPQPTLAASYHQLLQLPTELPSQSESFEQSSHASFSNGRASIQSPSTMFDNGTFPMANLPFNFLPLGITSPLAEPPHVDSISRHQTVYHFPGYYQNMTSQDMSSDSALHSQLGASCVPRSQETMPANSSATSVLASSQSSQDRAGDLQGISNVVVSDATEQDETQRGGELDLAFSSCALGDTPPTAEKTHQHTFSPSRSNKRSRSVVLASDGASKRKKTGLSQGKTRGCSPTSKRTKPRPVPNTHEAALRDLPMDHLSKEGIPKAEPKKKLRREKLCTPASYTSPSRQLNTPARPHILASKKIQSNILPPTPDSLQRPSNSCCDSRDGLDSTEQAGKKRRKIESIEKALEALDTLTDYLSKEANESSANCDDPRENHTPISPNQYHWDASLSLVSPHHFFTLGDLGGRLRRRLDAARR